MAIYYEKCKKDSEQLKLVADVAGDHHADLCKANVTIAVIMAANPKGGTAIKLHGYPCAATVRVVPYKQRVQGLADAEIILDLERWSISTDETKRAIIDHELQHLEVIWKDGKPKTDDLDRPKLRVRLHDWEIGGFASVAERNGGAALEVAGAHRLKSQFGQYVFDFAEKAGATA